ncbi:MAG: acyl carrier protein [Oscillospiraceae bacterium]
MEKVIEILQEIKEGVDYKGCTTLIDDAIFDSFDIIQTINSLNEEFDIEIPATEIVPQNFNSAAALWAMVERLMEE